MSGEQLTLLPAESLASLSVWPGSEQARQMTVTSGQRCLAFLRSCDPVSSALRTLVGSSIWHSTTCLLTWHHKVTKQGRSYYQLRASVPPTSERGSGSWPTPRARDAHAEGVEAGIRHKEKWGSQTLATAARVRPEGMWPTPHATESEMRTHKRTPAQEAGKHGLYLQVEALRSTLWPTPVANDDNKSPEAHMAMKQRMKGGPRNTITSLQVAVKATMLPSPRASAMTTESMESFEARRDKGDVATPKLAVAAGVLVGQKLNPAWVSRMMGFPDSWMDVGEETL